MYAPVPATVSNIVDEEKDPTLCNDENENVIVQYRIRLRLDGGRHHVTVDPHRVPNELANSSVGVTLDEWQAFATDLHSTLDWHAQFRGVPWCSALATSLVLAALLLGPGLVPTENNANIDYATASHWFDVGLWILCLVVFPLMFYQIQWDIVMQSLCRRICKRHCVKWNQSHQQHNNEKPTVVMGCWLDDGRSWEHFEAWSNRTYL